MLSGRRGHDFDLRQALVGLVDRREIAAGVDHGIIQSLEPRPQLRGVGFELFNKHDRMIFADAPGGGEATTVAARVKQKREAIEDVLSQLPQSSLLATKLRVRQQELR